METTTRFDLNRAIQQWRENLGQSPAFRSENLHELETHLRDSIATLQRQGLSAEEAFFVAANRIGERRSLETEFGKVNRRALWLDRVLWMLIGIQVWGLTSGLVSSVARNAYAFGWRNLHYDWKTNGIALPVAVFTVSQVLAFAASIAICWWLIIRKGGRLLTRLTPWLRRRPTFIAIFVALCVFALCVNVFSNVLPVLLFWDYGGETVREATMYSSYAQLWVSPFEIAVAVAATLILVRRRIRASHSVSATC